MSREALLAEIARIASSSVLRGSESLCRLLRYLGDYSLDHPGISVKEHQVATEVFGKGSDFDPRLDSTVRVQTSRLRSKLVEYYAGEGAGDALIVEIPRGSYTLAVHPRPEREPKATATLTTEILLPPIERKRGPAQVAVWSLGFLSGGLILAVAYMTWVGMGPRAAGSGDAPAPLRTFWQRFVDGPEPPWIIYSNAEFIGRPETGMRYFDASRDDRSRILDHYTGVGEVIAIHELDHLFTQLHHNLVVKRGRLLTMDDARNNDLVFIGSPSENLTLREIPTTQQFVFRLWDQAPRKGDLAIVNLHPKQDEPTAYFATAGSPLLEDYALVGLVPGINAARWVLILAGTTTIGTQAAVEYVCRADNVEQLLKRVGQSRDGGVQPFEAVLRVRVSRGVPVESELVALHTGPR